MITMIKPVETVADHHDVRTALTNLDDVSAAARSRLGVAADALRSATAARVAVEQRNRTTALRIKALTAEIGQAGLDRLPDLRASRNSLASDHRYAGDDCIVAWRREITAAMTYADEAISILSGRNRVKALAKDRAALDAARHRLSNPNLGLTEAGIVQAFRDGAAAADRVVAAADAEADHDAIDAIDRFVSALFSPIRMSYRPDGWRIARQKMDLLIEDLALHHRQRHETELLALGQED